MRDQREKNELDVKERKCLQCMCEVKSMNRMWKREMRCRFGVRENMKDTVDGNGLKWFRRMERVRGKGMTKRQYKSNKKVEGL